MNTANSLASNELALHRREALEWEKGAGSFADMEVAYVSRSEKGRGFAAFHRAKKTKVPHHEGKFHAHTSASHTLVLAGVVSAQINGETYTLRAGDYFRCPAGLGHVGSQIDVDALMFVYSDGPMELDFNPARTRKSMVVGASRTASAPAIFRRRGLEWNRGAGSFKDMEVAVVSRDGNTGAQVLFHRAGKSPDFHHAGKPHFHTSTSHTIILSGAVGAEFGGWQIYGKPGDYIRCPAGLVHTGSHVMDPAGMFVICEGAFDLKLV